MSLWKIIDGLVEVEMTAAEPERELNAITLSGIELFNVSHERDLTYSFTVCRRDFARLVVLCERKGLLLKIARRQGIFYALQNLRQRRFLLFGIGIIVLSTFFLPSRVLFVRVEGNNRIPANQIVSAAEECGICFGAARRYVRSEKVKNALLDSVPELQWAGVNTIGCTAVISVRERTVRPILQNDSKVSSIIADRDGYILSCAVTRGSALVQPGQTVRKGQILISGYTECGISIQATQAKGEIIAQTARDLTVFAPISCERKAANAGITRKISLLLGKKRIFFWKGSGISDTGCGRMYEEYRFTLPGGFQLPIALCVDTCQRFDLRASESDAPSLGAFAQQYLKTQMVAGLVRSGTQTVLRGDGFLLLRGNYVCTESIGKVKPEQIGETNGKTNREER